jgi:hypothetical protein
MGLRQQHWGTPPAPPDLNIIFYFLNHTRRISVQVSVMKNFKFQTIGFRSYLKFGY